MNPFSLHAMRKVASAALATLILTGGAVAQTSYIATRIPALTDKLREVATGMNAAGAVIGYQTVWDAPESGFMFDAGVVRDLGKVIPTGINDTGQLVGRQLDSPGVAFLMTGGVARKIVVPGGFAITANAIDASGNVAGYYEPADFGPRLAFTLRDGSFVGLGVLDESSRNSTLATAISPSGDIVGSSGIGERSFHAVLWSRAHVTDLGTLGGSYSYARGINARGEIVGGSTTAGGLESRAFIYSNGSMRDLGTPPGDSVAMAINADGVVVGWYTNDEHHHVAFVYSNGTRRDLTAQVVSGLDGDVYEAVAINDAGQIAANACSADTCFAVRLDPVTGSERVAIEYHHAQFDHYFVTADTAEIAKLDSGSFEGWKRTGLGFVVAPGPAPSMTPVCRFFSTSFGTRSSHFYTASPEECLSVQRNLAHDWTFEGNVFWVATPDADGSCPKATAPVYRLYNDGQGGAPNHRYTTSLTIREEMLASGWISEGNGALGVSMCALA